MLHDLFKHMEHFDLSFFSNSTASQFVRHLLLKGTLQDIEVLQKRLQAFLGDLTFLEAFNLSGQTILKCVSPFGVADCWLPLRMVVQHPISRHEAMSCIFW